MTQSTGPEANGLAPRPRVLIPLTIAFAVRYVVRTGLLDQLQRSCDPVLALTWDDPALEAELTALGASVVRLPEPRVDHRVGAVVSRQAIHFRRRLKSPSTRIDRARNQWGRPAGLRWRRWLRALPVRVGSRLPGDEGRTARRLAKLLDDGTNIEEYTGLLRAQRIDAVVSVTPFVSQEQVLLWAAERLDLPLLTSILSFDNLTTRPPLPVGFDHYLVWNHWNQAEVLRSYPLVEAGAVEIVGAAQFDFYNDRRYVLDEATWRAGLGLAADAPTVLYGAGAEMIAPHEEQHVDQLVEAVHDGRLPANLRVVVRRHPLDRSGRWDRFVTEPIVALDDPGRVNAGGLRPGNVDLGEDQVVGLCTSLAHSDVHVSVSSTMTIDGAFYDKPQVGPAFDARPGRSFDTHARALYDREHFVPIVASGGMAMAYDPATFITTVAAYLADPSLDAAARRSMLNEVATSTDGRSTDRVATAIAGFLDATTATDPHQTGE